LILCIYKGINKSTNSIRFPVQDIIFGQCFQSNSKIIGAQNNNLISIIINYKF